MREETPTIRVEKKEEKELMKEGKVVMVGQTKNNKELMKEEAIAMRIEKVVAVIEMKEGKIATIGRIIGERAAITDRIVVQSEDKVIVRKEALIAKSVDKTAEVVVAAVAEKDEEDDMRYRGPNNGPFFCKIF